MNTISPNYRKDELTEADIFNIHSQSSWFQKVVEAIFEKTNLATMINNFSKKIMIEKIRQNPKTHQNNADIRYDDYALIFLPDPHRIEIARETKRKLTKGF